MPKEKIYQYTEVNDSTPLQSLSLFDQLRAILKKITYDPMTELKCTDAVTEEVMTLKANLMSFIQKATEPIRKGNAHSVELSIDSKFNPVLDEVLKSNHLLNFYNITVDRPITSYDVPYKINVKLEVK